MSLSSNGDHFDPAYRPCENGSENSSKPTSITTKMSSWNNKDREILLKHKMKNNSNNKSNLTDQQMAINGELGSSSSSTGSFGDDQNNCNKVSSMHASLYNSGDDSNIPLDVINPLLDLVDEDDDAFSLPLSQQDEKLLEELLRLKLTSAPEATAASLLPPKQRLKLFQPRSKLEQFEDILLESQLLEASLPGGGSTSFSDIVSAADNLMSSNPQELRLPGLPIGPGGYPGMSLETLDFDTSDVIFGDKTTSGTNSRNSNASAKVELKTNTENKSFLDTRAEKDASNVTKDISCEVLNSKINAEPSSDSQQNNDSKYDETSPTDQVSIGCDCSSCHERDIIESNRMKEITRLRNAWFDVREQVWKVYHLVINSSWTDVPSRERPDLFKIKTNVRDLCARDPHQLFQRLEAGVREFVIEMKLRLIELLQRQAKNPSLAQDFIQNLLEGYQKLCDAAQKVSPALVDLEEKHLNRFTLTWEVFNKHLYQSVIYTDHLIQNNLPIFISQLRSLYPDKEHEAKYTELVREYLDFDVEMEHVGAFWVHSESQITQYNKEQNILRAKQKMLKEDWEKFKSQRNEVKNQIMEKKSMANDIDYSEILSSEGNDGGSMCDCDACAKAALPSLSKCDNELNIQSETENVQKKDEKIAAAIKNMKFSSGPTKCSEVDDDNPSSLGEFVSSQNNNPESIAKLYPHLYSTILQGQTSLLRENANQSLAALFPSVLTAEGPKCKNDPATSEFHSYTKNNATLNQNKYPSNAAESVAAELSLALSSALSLSESDVAQRDAVTVPYKDTMPRSETVISQSKRIGKEKNEIKYSHSCSPGISFQHESTVSSQNCAATKKRKHQPPTSESCSSTVQVNNVNVTSPSHTVHQSTTSTTTDGIRQEIGPPTLGDALQQKIRETQAKIKSNVISASSSQSLLPPGKCNSHHNHQTGSEELNQLLHQHYCGKRAPKAPSASAIRKGKVPPPPGSNVSPQSTKSSSTSGSESANEGNVSGARNSTRDLHPEDCESCCTTEELSDEEEDDDLNDFEEEESSQASTSTNATTTDPGATSSSCSSKHSHSHPNAHHHPCGNKSTCEDKSGKDHCSKDHCGESGKNHTCLCCYCEMFGHGGPSAAPVSKNYPEMRERLRLLLSKKKKNIQQTQHETNCQNEPTIPDEQQRKSSSSSISSSKSSSNTRKSKVAMDLTNVSTADKNAVVGSVAVGKENGSIQDHIVPSCENERIRSVSVKSSESKHITAKENLSQSSSRSSVSDNKSSLNQDVKAIHLDKSLTSNEIEILENLRRKDQNLRKANSPSLSNVATLAEQECKIKDVDELLNYIEGNQKAVANDKKRAKKERQKQQKIEELRRKEEEEKRLKAEIEKERRRIEEEKKKQEEEERLRFKKMNKKAAQKAKKLAAKGLPVPSPDNVMLDNIDAKNKSKKGCTESENTLDPIETLEHLKAQHLKELQQLQQLHRQQLEEEHKKLVKKQEEQTAIQRKPQKLGQTDKKENKKGKINSKTEAISMQTNSTLKLSNSVQASAYKTLAEAAQNPGNQIKITGVPNGGVEFSTVPAGQHHDIGSLPTSTPPMVGKTPAPPPYLQEIFNRNPSIQPNIPSNMTSQSSHGTKNESENVRPCVPSLSNQPMVTIRRVETPSGSDPTVTISMKQDQVTSKHKVSKLSDGSNHGQDKLLYTLVNGKILKPGEVPDHLLQQTKNLPPHFNQEHTLKVAKNSTNQNTSYSANSMKPTRPPLPLDLNGKVDLNRLELPSGISITKVEGQAPERKYFPSKPSESHDQNMLPLPGQHESQRGTFPNLANSRANGSGPLPQPPYSVNSVGQYNVPGIGPTNPNNVIVVDTSSLADNANAKKPAGTQISEKANKKTKKKSKSSQHLQSKPLPSPSPQPTRKIPMAPSSYPQQQKSNSTQPIKPSQNTEKRVTSLNNNSSMTGDLKSGPQVLIKNVNGRVIITPVPGTGTGESHTDATSKKLEQNKLEKSKSTPDASKTAATPGLDKTNIKASHPEIDGRNRRPKLQLSTAGNQHIQDISNLSHKSKSNQAQRSASSSKSEILSINGMNASNSQSSKGECVSSSRATTERNAKECGADEALKPIHNKLSKSVNDVENVGGRKRSKKNSIGDNFEDLNSVFVPKDIDLENGEMDDDEREIEAFKRFCFNSVPLQEKPKVNFDMKSISLKKK